MVKLGKLTYPACNRPILRSEVYHVMRTVPPRMRCMETCGMRRMSVACRPSMHRKDRISRKKITFATVAPVGSK